TKYIDEDKTFIFLLTCPFLEGIFHIKEKDYRFNKSMLTSFFAGLGLGLFISLSMGPVIFMIIKYSINDGFKAGLSFVTGVSASDIMYVILGNVATAFIYELDGLKTIIGVAGGLVLITIGVYGLFFKDVTIKSGEEDRKEEIKANKGHFFRIWLSGFLMNTLNPAVLILWLGVCTANSALSANHRIVLFITALVFVLTADITKVFFADKIRHKITLKTVSILNKIASISMLIFGTLLIYAVLFQMDRFFSN